MIDVYLERNRNTTYFYLNFFQFKLKRIFDILFSLILIILSSIVILLSAFLIFVEDGLPVFFKQYRTGKDMILFNVFKLRTMKNNSEKDGPRWSKANDNRITYLGKFLRLQDR